MVHLQKIPFAGTHAFHDFFLKYIGQDESLQPFYAHFPSIDNFEKQIQEKAKSFPVSTRRTLVETLVRQYKPLANVPEAVNSNVQSLLQDKTFTVTTGHQLNIFTGPLYFIYKIVTVINACKKLKVAYPGRHFVPVYWMASEDHDYEEIKSFRLYGKKYTWETSQQGCVGRFSPRDLDTVLRQLPGDVSIFMDAYQQSQCLADAVRQYVNSLFGAEGLIVMDADDRGLKALLQPVMREDLFAQTPHAIVSAANNELEALGYHPQVNPREINFFYLDKNLRSRIEKKEDGFVVVDTPLKFSRAQMESMVRDEPEKLSPNVILRPLYQELILPNLAYVGGPAELVYWLELKNMFTHFHTPFPILMPRNFALVIEKHVAQKIGKTGLEIQDFFEEKNYLFNHWIAKNSSQDLSLGKEMKLWEQLLTTVEGRATTIDATLGPMTRAEATRIRHALEKIETKMLQAERRRHTDKLRQIEAVKDILFPTGSLQERTDNFLNFYQQDGDFIRKLLDALDPFDFQFNVLQYHD